MGPGSGCCGVPRRLTVKDCFTQGKERMRAPMLPIQGRPARAASGLTVQFSLRAHQDRLEAVSFRASSCVTLVAYCELLSEWATGNSREEALELQAAELIAALPEVPLHKHDRAHLAIAALRAALDQAKGDEVL